jgi:hypothetical protein
MIQFFNAFDSLLGIVAKLQLITIDYRIYVATSKRRRFKKRFERAIIVVLSFICFVARRRHSRWHIKLLQPIELWLFERTFLRFHL